MTITAAVDGSSLGNPGPAGWAWVVSKDTWGAGGWPSGTNNMGELTALLELLRATAAAGHGSEPLVVLADSKYTIDCVTKWMGGWKRKGWRKADGKPVLNREILEAIDEAIAGRNVRFEWVKGHAGHDMNELADEKARAAAEAYKSGAPVPRGPGFSEGNTSEAGIVEMPTEVNQSFQAEEVPRRWGTIAWAAFASPVTIHGKEGRSLTLMESSLARRALDALGED